MRKMKPKGYKDGGTDITESNWRDAMRAESRRGLNASRAKRAGEDAYKPTSVTRGPIQTPSQEEVEGYAKDHPVGNLNRGMGAGMKRGGMVKKSGGHGDWYD